MESGGHSIVIVTRIDTATGAISATAERDYQFIGDENE